MANPLPNEEELYKRIKDEQITIPPFIWDAMYNLLGDYITFINLQVSYYIEQNKPVPVAEGKKILEYCLRSMEVVHKIIHPQKITDHDVHLQEVRAKGVALHPLVKEFYTHYLGNDMH